MQSDPAQCTELRVCTTGTSEASTTQLALVIGIPQPHSEAGGVYGPRHSAFWPGPALLWCLFSAVAQACH